MIGVSWHNYKFSPESRIPPLQTAIFKGESSCELNGLFCNWSQQRERIRWKNRKTCANRFYNMRRMKRAWKIPGNHPRFREVFFGSGEVIFFLLVASSLDESRGDPYRAEIRHLSNKAHLV